MAAVVSNSNLIRAAPFAAAECTLSGMTDAEDVAISHKGPRGARLLAMVSTVTTKADAGNLEVVYKSANVTPGTDTITVTVRISGKADGNAGDITNCVARLLFIFADS